MRLFLAIVTVFSVSLPAYAETVPEPETLGLLAIGALGLLLARRKK